MGRGDVSVKDRQPYVFFLPLILISPAFGIQNGKPRDIRLEMEERAPLLSVAMNCFILP